MRTALLCTQVATFIALGLLLVIEGHYRLGAGQLLLAAVQTVIYA